MDCTKSKYKTQGGAISRILSALPDARETNGGWSARCPAHDDSQASLSIGQGDDGRVLLHCHAGCETSAIVGKIGLAMRDLMPSSTASAKKNSKPQIVATYDYRDADSTLLYQGCRYDPKDFRQRAPKPGGGWSWSIKGVKRVPYRLPELIAADSSKTVFIVEGEKDADNLFTLGLTATTNAGGAGKWQKDFAKYFAGRSVVILPDNDKPGRDHARDVTKKLYGTAATIKIIELPGLPKKGDVSDWLDDGHTIAELQSLVDAAPVVTAEDIATWEDEIKSSPEVKPDNVLPLTDSGLAERFARRHGDKVRYCHPWAKCLAWDGMRWRIDDTGAVNLLAKETARAILAEAASVEDDDARRKLVSFARQSEAAARRDSMLRLARCEPPLPILPEALDRDPWLLNCPNGTIELKTGKLRVHRREDYMTKLCRVNYTPDAKCPIWFSFLDGIFEKHYELIDFIQRFCGYVLTGDVSEQVLPIFYGVGANGKSTFVSTILNILGADYSIKAPTDFLVRKKQDAHPTEIADLHGKRLIAAVETDDGRRLAESLVKELTGGDRIRARRMREDFWEFVPTHKVILACNHKPEVRGTDHAIWRRIRLVPFNVIIPREQQDKKLPDKLAVELPGILAWCVRGCLDWQQQGLGYPADVEQATESYRSDQDALGAFLAEQCMTGTAYKVRAGELYSAYKAHCDSTGESALSQRRFGERLTERGIKKYTSNGIWYEGVGLSAQ